MRNVIKALFFVLLVLSFLSCATMIHTNYATVSTASGADATVQITENGLPIYVGSLPTQIPVKSGHTYIIHFTLENGEARTITIGEKFNGWLVGSILLGLLPAVIDLATGNVMQIEQTTILPITYSPMIILGENISDYENLKVIGNINKL